MNFPQESTIRYTVPRIAPELPTDGPTRHSLQEHLPGRSGKRRCAVYPAYRTYHFPASRPRHPRSEVFIGKLVPSTPAFEYTAILNAGYNLRSIRLWNFGLAGNTGNREVLRLCSCLVAAGYSPVFPAGVQGLVHTVQCTTWPGNAARQRTQPCVCVRVSGIRARPLQRPVSVPSPMAARKPCARLGGAGRDAPLAVTRQ